MNPEEIVLYDSYRDLSTKPFRSACYAGYTSMVFDSIGRVRICCVNFDYILGDIRVDRLDDIWNGPRLKMLRDALGRYDFGLGCSECEVKINAGIMEGATLRNSQFVPLKYESFKIESEPPYWPKHLEFHLSNKCNLQCVTCSGEFSSVIRAKREKLPPYQPAYNDQFFEDLRKYLPHLEQAQFLGGEPFIIPEMHRVWNMLIDDNLSPYCHITTNGTVFGPEVERILTSLPVSVNVSMDGITPKTFESIRVNAKFDRVLKNALRIRDIIVPRGLDFGFNFTLSRMNWHEYVDFLLFAESENIPVSTSNVLYPVDMSLFHWDVDQLKLVVDRLEQQCVEAGPRLKRNRELLEKKIQELRFAVQKKEEGQNTESPSFMEMFRGSTAGPETLWFTRSRALDVINQWATSEGVCEIQTDSNDTLIYMAAGSESIFADLSFVGQEFYSLVKLMLERHGSKVLHISLSREKSHIDRVFRVEGGRYPPVEVRIIITPTFDENGVLNGARAFFSNRAASVVAS